jgi:hypothetical protein
MLGSLGALDVCGARLFRVMRESEKSKTKDVLQRYISVVSIAVVTLSSTWNVKTEIKRCGFFVDVESSMLKHLRYTTRY